MSFTSPGASTERALVDLRSRRGVVLIAATVLSSLLGFFDAYVVVIAVPAIKQDLGGSVTAIQFVVTGYLLTVAALLLLSGALADRFGLRRVLGVGLLVMLVASVLCSIVPSIEWLIAARVAQGVGGALVVPTSLAMLNGTLQVADRARGIGIWAGLSTLGMTVGPYIGGWLVDLASWRLVFLVNVPLVIAALGFLRFVPATGRIVRSAPLDLGGAALAVVGLGGVTYALTLGPEAGWTDPLVLGTAVVGVVCLIALVLLDRRLPAPLLRLSLFASRQFDAINVTTVLLYGAFAAANYLLVLQCELRLGYSAADAGAVLIPESVVFLLLSPFIGGLVARIGPRWLMLVGILCVAVAFVLLSGASPGQTYVEALLPGVLMWGLGVGLLVTPLTAAVLGAVSDSDLGEASAINDGAARVGALLVTALVPVLIGSTGGQSLASAIENGYQFAMIVMAALCVLAAIVAGVFVSNRRVNVPLAAPAHRLTSCALPVTARQDERGSREPSLS